MPLNQASFTDWAPRLLSVLRIVTALLFILSGQMAVERGEPPLAHRRSIA